MKIGLNIKLINVKKQVKNIKISLLELLLTWLLIKIFRKRLVKMCNIKIKTFWEINKVIGLKKVMEKLIDQVVLHYTQLGGWNTQIIENIQ
jgi:hypothetical protein